MARIGEQLLQGVFARYLFELNFVSLFCNSAREAIVKISKVIVCAILPVTAVLAIARAADVVNGWSPVGTITKVHSVYSYTYLRLSSTPNGCGHADFWALPVNDTSANKVKHALLMSAFAAGKTVALRCENSVLSDFEIYE